MKILNYLFVTVSILALTPALQAWQETSIGTTAPVVSIDVAVVSSIDDIEVPARVKGFINQMEFEEGDVIQSGTIIAQLDTTLVGHELQAATIRKDNAERQASDQTPIVYAQATLDVSQKDLEREASLRRTRSGPQRDYERAQLAVRQAELQVERSKAQQEIDRGAVELETANISSVQDMLQRHSIVAPWSGIQPSSTQNDVTAVQPEPTTWQIIEINRRSGEFVQEGQTIVRLVDLSKVKVEGHVSATNFDASQLSGRPVKVTLELAQGQPFTFDGEIKSIGLEQKLGGLFVVQAIVENQKQGDQWLLRPNTTVSMEIELQ
ncbi:MAG: efflux RND transporter periplasmic adaptor subunit [Pirellulaceae bacterium]